MARPQTVPARSRFQEALGKAIRSIRQERNLKQYELADDAGVELGHLGEIERGQGNPTFETQVQIVIALETSFGRVGALIDEYLEGWGLQSSAGGS
jgi:transcriptional regulator with XRE-family HTH domain